MLDLLWRLGGRSGPRDGQAQELVAVALETTAGQIAGQEDVETAESRRSRETLLHTSLSSKILGAHLDNRHQTSYPLTIDFRSLNQNDGDLLLDAMSASILADGRSDNARIANAMARLKALGGKEREAARLAGVIASPRPLSTILPAILSANIAAHAYAISLIALPHPSGTARLYLNYLAARLALSQEVTASLNRRYRR